MFEILLLTTSANQVSMKKAKGEKDSYACCNSPTFSENMLLFQNLDGGPSYQTKHLKTTQTKTTTKKFLKLFQQWLVEKVILKSSEWVFMAIKIHTKRGTWLEICHLRIIPFPGLAVMVWTMHVDIYHTNCRDGICLCRSEYHFV